MQAMLQMRMIDIRPEETNRRSRQTHSQAFGEPLGCPARRQSLSNPFGLGYDRPIPYGTCFGGGRRFASDRRNRSRRRRDSTSSPARYVWIECRFQIRRRQPGRDEAAHLVSDLEISFSLRVVGDDGVGDACSRTKTKGACRREHAPFVLCSSPRLRQDHDGVSAAARGPPGAARRR